jgi:hypothetical protein
MMNNKFLSSLGLALMTVAVGCAADTSATPPEAPTVSDTGGAQVVVSRAERSHKDRNPQLGSEKFDPKMAALEVLILDPLKEYIGAQTGGRLIDLLMGGESGPDYTEQFEKIDQKLEALSELSQDTNKRVTLLQGQLAMSTAYITKMTLAASISNAFARIDTNIDEDGPSGLAYYTNSKRDAASKQAGMKTFVENNPSQAMAEALQAIDDSIQRNDYLGAVARYAALSANQPGSADSAMALLEAQYLTILSHQLNAMKLIVMSENFKWSTGTATQDVAVADIEGRRTKLQAQIKVQADLFLEAAAALGGMLGSNPLHNRLEEDGNLHPDANIQGRLARASVIAASAKRALDNPNERAARPQGVVARVGVLTRAVDADVAKVSLTQASAVLHNQCIRRKNATSSQCDDYQPGGDLRPATCCAERGDVTRPVSDLSGAKVTEHIASSKDTGKYGYLARNEHGEVSLAVAAEWRYVEAEVLLPTDTSKASVQLTVGNQARSLDITADGNDARTLVGAIDMRYDGDSSRLSKMGFSHDHHDFWTTWASYNDDDALGGRGVARSIRALTGQKSGAGADNWGRLEVEVPNEIPNAVLWTTDRNERQYLNYRYHQTYTDRTLIESWINSCDASTNAKTMMSNSISFGDKVLSGKNRGDYSGGNCTQSNSFSKTVGGRIDGINTSNNLQNLASTSSRDPWSMHRMDLNIEEGKHTLQLDAGYNNRSTDDQEFITVTVELGAFNVYVAGSGT